MILTDAGPLIAILDRNDRDHALCVEALNALTPPLVTTWPAFTEAMYLLGATTGWQGQQSLWDMVKAGHLEILELSVASVESAAQLMEKYADRPMDLADATLVAAAGQLSDARVFTLDSDFRFYRLANGKSFALTP